jgi:hypothetical protein
MNDFCFISPVCSVQSSFQERGVVVRFSVKLAVLDEGGHDGVADVTIQGKTHFGLASFGLE